MSERIPMKNKKPGKIVFIILISLILLFVVLSVFSKKAGESEFYSKDLPSVLIIAHQGGNGLWPGNTLYAFQNAVDMGVDVIETDIRQTKDGILVVSHDDTVDRISNGSGSIIDLTFTELQTLDAGYNWTLDEGQTYPYRGTGITYLSVEEMFVNFPSMRFNIDMKQIEPPIYENLCSLIREYHMEKKVIAASFSHENINAFRKLCPEVTTSGDETETRNFVFLNFAYLGSLYSPDFKVFQVPIERSGITILTPHFVRASHQRGLRVDAWTIDDPAEMQYLINMGVDGIITDRPDLLMDLLGR